MFILNKLITRINNYNNEIDKIESLKREVNLNKNDNIKVQEYLLRTSIL